MKKHAVMLGALLAAAATGAQAQTGSQIHPNGEAKVKVSVTFTPLVEIKLTPGKDDKLSFSFENVSNYEKGLDKVVDGQLSVFAVGSGYEVSAAVSSSSDHLLGLFQLSVGGAPLKEGKSKNMTVFTSEGNSGNGWKPLSAQYKLKPLQGNLAAFNELLKKDAKGNIQPRTIDITYTIVAK